MTDALPPQYDLSEATEIVIKAIWRRIVLLLQIQDTPPGEDPMRFRARCELGQLLDSDSGLPEDFPVVELMRIHHAAYRAMAEDDSVDAEATQVLSLCADAVDRALDAESPEEFLWNDEDLPPIDRESFVRIGVETVGDPELRLPPKRYH